MTWLRRLALAMAVLALVAGAAAAWVFGTPMEVVLPLRVIAAVAAVLVLGLLAAAWWLGRDRGWLPLVIVIADLALVVVVLFATLRAPACRDFSVDNTGVQLAGAVCLPDGDGPAPTAILVHGSGPETRDEYRFYAENLARAGIAAVIYDKRGAGDSTGDTYGVGYEGYAADLAAVARWAAGQPFAEPGQVGFVGFSEAEWVMPLAARSFEPAFVVVVGASALSPHDQVAEEIAIRLERSGYAPEDIEAATETHEALGRYLRGDLSPEEFGAILDDAKSQPWFRVAADLPDEVYPRDAYAWWVSVMDIDPATWRDYAGPVLFVKGTADDRSDAERAAERFAAVLPDPDRQLELRLVEGADHMVLLWPRGDRSPPPAFPEGYPALIADWILAVTSG